MKAFVSATLLVSRCFSNLVSQTSMEEQPPLKKAVTSSEKLLFKTHA
jgi:hypothetical protein